MRISPINLKYNQNMQLKKAQQHTKQNSPSFGNFESPDIENILKDSIVVYNDPHQTKRINYLKTTPFVTVKKGQDKEGKTMLYAVMNKDVTDKHKNKEFFDKMLKNCKELVELGALSYLDIIEAGIPNKEPYFIGPIANRIDLADVYGDIKNAEEAYEYTPAKSSDFTPPQEEDLWLKAVSREILN